MKTRAIPSKSLAGVLAACLSLLPGVSAAGPVIGKGACQGANFNAGGAIRLTPAMVTGWANTIGTFFNSRTTDLSMLNSVLPHLSRFDLNDPAVRASLEPVTRQIQAVAEQLSPAGAWSLRKAIVDGQSAQSEVPVTLEKLEVLNTFFGAHLTEYQRQQAQEISQAWRGQLSEEKRSSLDTKMKGIAEALKRPSDAGALSADQVAMTVVDLSMTDSALGQKPMPKEGQLQPASHDEQIRAAARAHGIDLPQTHEPMDLGTMDNLLKGYAILNSRNVYGGGNADADLLRQVSGQKFQVKAVLGAELKKGLIYKAVTVYLTAEDGSRSVYLTQGNFFRTASAQRYLESLPVGKVTNVYFTAIAPGRLVSVSPFYVGKLEPVVKPSIPGTKKSPQNAAIRNLENLIVAMTSGGIEAQEAAGQRKLVSNELLPIDGLAEVAKALGLKYDAKKPADDLFAQVKLPPGWSKRPTDHSMWSDLVDDKGVVRAEIFYKAAFYDQRASIRLVK